eukprot:6264994-Amphidinium_carterae.1
MSFVNMSRMTSEVTKPYVIPRETLSQIGPFALEHRNDLPFGSVLIHVVSTMALRCGQHGGSCSGRRRDGWDRLETIE